MTNQVPQRDMKLLGRKGSLGEITDDEARTLAEIVNADSKKGFPYPEDTKDPIYKGLFDRRYIRGEEKGKLFGKKNVLIPTETGIAAYWALVGDQWD